MTLSDIMKPNKFGTVPMLLIVGLGLGVFENGMVRIRSGIANISTELLPLSTEAKLYDNSTVYVNHPELMGYTIRLVHWVKLTPENRLIHQAIEPIYTVHIEAETYMSNRVATEELMDKAMNDGTGWVNMGYGEEPVTFYVEDILYRLDLQGKLT